MFPYLYFVLYILCAAGVGFLARRTRMGWFGAFLLSLVVTPLVSFVLVIGLTRLPRSSRRT